MEHTDTKTVRYIDVAPITYTVLNDRKHAGIYWLRICKRQYVDSLDINETTIVPNA